MKYFLVCVIAAISAQAADETRKQAWEWTIEERVALRREVKLTSLRVGEELRYRIDGAAHPELFLPHEVFEGLVRFTFPKGVWSRETCHLMTRRGKLPADSCERIQLAAAIFAADLSSLNDIRNGLTGRTGRARQDVEAALALKEADLCRSRAEALDAMRHEFGRQLFDRFLYEVIAVRMGYSTDRLWDSQALRRSEEGCTSERE